ncbi:hypothetical protein DPEC_G00347410 [Dallia pectoralis]|uniref:Uncharacterized protein n=1 Tax=Dallia pectoralis TaxID=75939 RepID=A0ACC2F421_DALPE|nr:hypothetical protein DPEC_G00347410 [Dallia pectoralis]
MLAATALQDRSAELQRLQRSMVLLHEREMEWAREKSALQSQLSCAREELHSAPLRVRMSEVLLQDQEVLVAQRLLEERGPQDGEQLEWKERPHTVSDQPRLTAAELKEEHRAKGSALRSLILQEEDTHRLAAQNQELQHSLEELHDRDGQQVAVCFLRAELQRWQSEARAQQESREEEVSTLRADLKEAQGRHRHCRATREHLLSDLEQARRQAGQAEKEASDRERCLRGLEAELSRLRSVLQEAESGGVDTEALTQSLDLYRTKYQACLTKISQQNSILQAKDEDLKETRAQVTEQEEQVVCLRAQVAVLQGELRACSAQLDSGDDALDTLSRRLRDTQRDLDDSHKHSQECELVIRTLRDTTATLRRQVEEHEESVVKIQADFCDYKATHIHSDSDYNSQLSRIEELQQASSQAVEQCAQGTQELSACQSEVDQLREEVSRLAQLNANSLTEVLQLQEAGRQLQAEAMIEEQRRLQEVGALEQNAARLEQEVQAAHSRCAQRQQAVQKRDSLLRRSEADLLEAREALRSRALEVEKQAAVVRGLEADLQRARREGQQKDQECVSLRTQLMTVMEELKKTQGRYRDTAQELARQEEKVVLVEGAQQRAQGHLAERVAELERAEQNQRSQRAEIRTLKKRLHTTERELQGSRARVEVLEKETEEGRQAQIKAQQEASTHQQVVEQLEAELTSTKDTIRTLQQQLKEQERTVEVLQEQLAEVQSATWRIQEEHTACQSQLHQCKMELETREETREDQSLKQSQEVRSCEGRLAELCVQLEWSQHRCQEQLVALEAKEEMMLVMKVEMSSLRENLHAKMAQVDDLHSQLHSMEDIYTTAANEVEVLRRSLESSRSDVCHLTRESDLVVTNISQWVKMQRQGNDKFNLLIKDQRKKIIRLAAENDHLQECVDGLQRQVERLTAELVESRMEESQICSGCGRGLK